MSNNEQNMIPEAPDTEAAEKAKAAADAEAIMRKYDRESNTRVWEGVPKIIVGGVRALTGRTIRLVEQPLQPRGAERVGYFTDKVRSDKAFVEEYFRLRADPEIDVVPVKYVLRQGGK